MTTPETALPEKHLCTICLRPHTAALTPTAPPLDVERLRLSSGRVLAMFQDNPQVAALGSGYVAALDELRTVLAAESDTPERPA